MAAWQVELDPRAENEARAAFLWYLERNERAADKFQKALDATIDKIAEAPHRWPKIEPDIHKKILRRFPYSVLYTIDGGIVRVIAVMHQRRRPGYWKK